MKLIFAAKACAALAASAPISCAEALYLADFLDEVPGFVREGRLAGLEAWRSEVSGEIWFLAPDGKTIVAGRVVASRDSPLKSENPSEFSKSFKSLKCSIQRSGCAAERTYRSEKTGGALSEPKNVYCRHPDPESISRCQNYCSEGASGGEIPKLSKVRAALGKSDAREIESEQSKLLESLRRNAFWFGVGRRDSPPVYAIVDPVCPYSVDAMHRFKKLVESGSLHLRIILIATARRDSAATVASILQQPEPPEAFWEHAMSLARNGRSNLRLGDYGNLPAGLRGAVQANSELSSELGIPGVPFFAFGSSEGAFSFAGAPANDQLARILGE